MSYLLAVGITVGILAGVWCYVAVPLGLLAFAGFLGWASYFAAGSGLVAVRTAALSNLSGVIWGLVTVYAGTTLSMVPGLVFTILFAAIMCWQAKVPLLAFIPGTFIGNAAFYASGNDGVGTAIALVCGIALGLISDELAKLMSRGAKKKAEEKAEEKKETE